MTKIKAKIIATIGPSSYDPKILKRMKKNGADIFRLNTKYLTERKMKKIYPLLKKSGLEIMIDINNLEVLKWVNDYDYEYLAVSFTSTANQIKKIRKLVEKSKRNEKVKIISKIENEKGMKNFDNILKESDGIMVARGDLSKNLSFEKIPVIQKKLVEKSKRKNKMTIIATEMLTSLVHHKSPEKSEVSDIANAVFEGVDALMLSEETAIGKYPSLAVKVMNKIIKEIEKKENKRYMK